MTVDYVIEQHPMLGSAATAVFDGCHAYRYALTRRWAVGPAMVFVMCNPSTADEQRDDPTVRRCMDFARRNGFGGLTVVNLFALRATNPAVLATHLDPVGPLNDQTIRQHTTAPGAAVVAAWGVHGTHQGRDRAVMRGLARRGVPVRCLGITKHLHPRHPLYVPAATVLRPYTHPEVPT